MTETFTFPGPILSAHTIASLIPTQKIYKSTFGFSIILTAFSVTEGPHNACVNLLPTSSFNTFQNQLCPLAPTLNSRRRLYRHLKKTGQMQKFFTTSFSALSSSTLKEGMQDLLGRQGRDQKKLALATAFPWFFGQKRGRVSTPLHCSKPQPQTFRPSAQPESRQISA